jgi:hypothetical protein
VVHTVATETATKALGGVWPDPIVPPGLVVLPAPVIAGPAWLDPPDGMPGVQPERKKMTAATTTTPAAMLTEAASRLRPLGCCP